MGIAYTSNSGLTFVSFGHLEDFDIVESWTLCSDIFVKADGFLRLTLMTSIKFYHQGVCMKSTSRLDCFSPDLLEGNIHIVSTLNTKFRMTMVVI